MYIFAVTVILGDEDIFLIFNKGKNSNFLLLLARRTVLQLCFNGK